MLIDINYISNFLSQVEGPRQTTAYIPCFLKSGGTANYKGGPNPENYKAMGASGVTIATGCDLGQTDSATLLAYGLEPAIVDVFQSYFGKKKDAAIAALHKWPLVISQDAAKQTDLAVHKGYLHRYVIPAYNKASQREFSLLPKEAQAVIMSVCFQKGCTGVRKDWPKLWQFLISQHWKAAANELLYGFSQYKNRRQTEGRLLKALG